MSDPLIEWTLERDVLRSDVRPHRLKSPDDSAVWLEAHEADQFERAKAITAAWAAGEAPPADDLPEGVSWALVADGSVVRELPDDEWERGYGSGWLAKPNAMAWIGYTYIVRRRPTPPAVETIDTRLAKGRTLPDGRQVLCTGDSDDGPWFRCYCEGTATFAATVEVLRQDGAA